MNETILYVVRVWWFVGLQGSLFAMEEKESKIELHVHVADGFNPAAKNFPTPDNAISTDEFSSIPLIVDVYSKASVNIMAAVMHGRSGKFLYRIVTPGFSNDQRAELLEKEFTLLVERSCRSLKIPLCRIEALVAQLLGFKAAFPACPLPEPEPVTIGIYTVLKGVKAEICIRNFTMEEAGDGYLAEAVAFARQVWSPLYDSHGKMPEMNITPYMSALRSKLLRMSEEGQVLIDLVNTHVKVRNMV